MFKVLTKGLIFKGDKLLLVKRKKESKFAGGLWDVPGGKLEFGEKLNESLIREIQEETSLKVKIENVINVSSSTNETEDEQYITIIYNCIYEAGEVILNEEHTEYKWVDLNTLKSLNKIYYLDDIINNIYDYMSACV